ncbi:MAG: UrcA family protein [Asticcacaulis sp.]|uniref:UrcA family protein n=1 Tax=Asticcacaulis sp. TaxID=1872648 RepID=UPI0039E385CA
MNRSIFIAAALSFVALTAGVANAQERQPEQVTVSARHVDFNNAREARSFYARLKVAAKAVCTSDVSDQMTFKADDACEHAALADAVRTVGAPQLSALHGEADRAAAYAERTAGTRNN